MAAPTPNMGLALPDDGQQGWGAAVRENFTALDALAPAPPGTAPSDQTIQSVGDAEVYETRTAYPPRALQYARTSSDQMRVNVDNTPTVQLYTGTAMWSAGSYALWYASGGPVQSMDERQKQAELSMQTFNQVRTSRWVVT